MRIASRRELPVATEQATAASPPELLSARAEVLVEQFADESFWARRGRGSSLYFSREESSTSTQVGTAGPRLSGRAKLDAFLTQAK
jgi:hypothetical protein